MNDFVKQKITQTGPDIYLHFWTIFAETDFERKVDKFYFKITTTLSQINNLEPFAKEAKLFKYFDLLSDNLFGRIRNLSE